MKLKLLLLLTAILACSCQKDKDGGLEVVTLPISRIEYFPDTDHTEVTVQGVLHGRALERGFILCKGNKFDFTKIPVPMEQEFSCVFDELENGTLYYVKAYALDSHGAIYGKEVSFTASTLPALEDLTDYAADLTGTTLLARGRIVSTGGEAITECGVYLGDAADPLQTRIPATDLAENLFSVDLRGLAFNADHVLTLFAANTQGETLTDPMTFHTPDLSAPQAGIDSFTEVAPTLIGVRLRAADNGGDPDCRFGLRYGTSASQLDTEAVCSEPDAEGYFTASVTSLAPDTEYWFAAYAVNAKSETVGTPTRQRTLTVSKPSVVNAAMREGFEILDYLVLKGQIASTGGVDISEYGFYYGEGAATNKVQASDVDAEGNFSVTLDASLVQPLTEYVFAAYAVNEQGEGRAAETTVRTGLVDRRSTQTQYLLDAKMQPDASGRQLVYFTLPSFEIEVNGERMLITFLDRNLGATELPTDAATLNFAAAGSYFQWGTNSIQASSQLAALRKEQGTNGKGTWNGYGKMSCYTGSLVDGDTWSGLIAQGTANVIDPCPEGYRLPTAAEWNAVCAAKSITGLQSMFEQLNFSLTGDFSLEGVYAGEYCRFWLDNATAGTANASYVEAGPSKNATVNSIGRKRPMTLRCVQVQPAE